VVASHAPGDSLRLDAFDRQTRQHLAVQSLPAGGFRQLLLPAKGDVDWKRAQLARGKGVLFVATAHGLNAYVPAGDERQQGGPHLLAYKALVKPTIDGSLDDWSGRRPAIIEPETSEESIASNSHTRQPGWDSSPAKLFFSHDSGFFFVGLSVPAETPVNHTGPGHLGGGDWLEIGITAGKNIRRWGFGIGKHGRPVWDDLGHGGRPPDSQLAIEYDALQQRLHYELAIPIQEVRPYHQRLFLSLMVWDEGPDGMSRRRFNWGGALRGAGIEAEHHGVAFTHSKQMEAEEAELAFVHAMPETRAAWSVFEELAAVRGSYSSDGLSELYRDYLERHPNSVFVNRILVRLAQSARQLSPQVAKNILSFAESCGVPPSVRNRFERQFKSRLSFQVHRDFSRRPSALRIHFNYSTRESAWRNAAWGYTHQHDALRAYGSMPDAGVWRPLAVPLMHVNMHDDPVHGLAIYHHGRGIVHWDRVALHLGEAERILIDDETPTGGKTSGDWTWTNKLAASGEKGFANRPNIGSLWQRLKEPATDHIVPPVTGAFLSQWVYLDAKRPPAWVGISLHDGSDWNFRLLWGSVWRGQSYPKEQDTSNLYFGHVIHRPDWSWLSNGFPVQKGRYMGRLPKPGEWQELQIPFSWTPFLDREVPGIRFEQFGGKVTWDRTSILAHGRDRIIIEDDVPPGEVKPQWKWTDELKKSGGSARVQIADNEYQFHHVYPLDEPIDTHLSGDAKEVVAALEKKLLLVANSAHRERLFDAGMRIVKARLKDPRQSIDAAQRLLKARVYPDSLRGAHLLGFLHQAHDRARQKNPRQSVETFVQQVGVPTDARYEYRRRYGAESGFSIRHWQILGSFPNEKCSGYFAAWPPEKDGIQLSTEYTSQYQNYRWRTFQSKEDFINLADAFPTDKLAEGNQESEIRIPESEVRNRGVAYAGCWIHVPEKQPAVLEFGASDGFRVWLNRNSILGNHRHGEASPRQVVKRVELPKGWSEMLVKVSHYKGGWGFTLQIIDSEGNGPPKGFKSQAVPPGADTETGPVKRVVLKGSNLLAKFKKEFRIPAGAFDKHRKRIRHGYDRATGLPLEIVHTATGMHFVFIPAGEFLMGSPESETGRNENEGPQHRVRITRAYYMGKYEVTQREWKSVMGTNPSHYAGESRPVELVSWHDCQGFVRKLNLGTPTFGLPTEAQWEYACRAGTKTRMFYGDDPGYRELNRYAWKGRQAKGQTHPVGQRRPNGWGIYDLYGNVWEWTQDGFGRYTEGLALDPAGRPESEMKVERSGSFQSGNAAFRSASRDPKPPDRRYKGLGLRLVVRY
ncbi:MAG: formylglycine-generating enzyme family protein, partial [Planctomycetota bacterium]|nr:formylglycine-generating enzyme family protein [Planctomycetota bacterium]